MSVLNKKVTYFPSVTQTQQGVVLDLLKILSSNKHKEVIQKIRNADEVTAQRIKSTLPCYTISGTFGRRSNDGLKELSGLAAVDLDSAEDYNPTHLLRELKKIDCMAYAGLSCRGKRLFCIVPFKYPDQYQRQYESLIKSFESIGLPMGDDCHKIISQPRYVSWNDESTQFFNHNARPYDLLPPEKSFHFQRSKNREVKKPSNSFQWCVDQINKSNIFKNGNRHNYLVQLVRYCNLKGLNEDETLKGCQGFIENGFNENEIRSIVSFIYTKHSGSHNIRPFSKYQY